jgi:hypothetical protein
MRNKKRPGLLGECASRPLVSDAKPEQELSACGQIESNHDGCCGSALASDWAALAASIAAYGRMNSHGRMDSRDRRNDVSPRPGDAALRHPNRLAIDDGGRSLCQHPDTAYRQRHCQSDSQARMSYFTGHFIASVTTADCTRHVEFRSLRQIRLHP